MSRIAVRALTALFLIAFSVTVFHWPYRALVMRGWNDFPGLYTAGSLIGNPDLYRKSAFLAHQAHLAGAADESIQFSRLPYYALVFWPFSFLPYSVAYWFWQICCMGALVGFSLLWPNGGRILPVLCLLPLVAASFANGQDVPFLLLWIALALWLQRRGHPVAAGLTLALGMAKPHLFLFLPIALIAKREWRMLAGAAAGAGVLIGLSFIVGGAAWPMELMTVWRDPALHPGITHTSLPAAIESILSTGRVQLAFYAAWLISVAGAVWVAARRLSVDRAIAAAITCSVVSALHVYSQDYMLCLPLVLLAMPAPSDASQAEPASPALSHTLTDLADRAGAYR